MLCKQKKPQEKPRQQLWVFESPIPYSGISLHSSCQIHGDVQHMYAHCILADMAGIFAE